MNARRRTNKTSPLSAKTKTGKIKTKKPVKINVSFIIYYYTINKKRGVISSFYQRAKRAYLQQFLQGQYFRQLKVKSISEHHALLLL